MKGISMTNQSSVPVNQLFYDEVLNEHESLSEIDDQYGPNTLATMFYFQHALVVDNTIDVWEGFHDGFMEMINTLPSADLFKNHIRGMDDTPKPKM